jgi:homoserine dehydrogenase
MKSTRVGIIGWGTVGAGVAKLLLEDRDLIRRKLGWHLDLAKVADLDLTTPRPVAIDADRLTTDASEIIDDPGIEIVVELIGGYEPARRFILEALAKGKHVVTANKALLAAHGPEIFQAAHRHGVDVLFEAAVGGGIPIIRSLKEGLAANRVHQVFGILNGTSNYILTKMTREGVDFQEALAEAQAHGYAEADPTFDVEGYDAAHKLILLVALAYGFQMSMDDLYVEGISRLDPVDIQFASEFGYVVKLLAISSQKGNEIEARLHPAMVPAGHLLTEVGGPFNAVYVNGHAVGEVMLYGAGAGMDATASAVVGDLIELARTSRLGGGVRVPGLAWCETDQGRLRLKSMDDIETTYYFRFSAVDRPGVLSTIAGLLGQNDISIAAVIQKGRELDGAVPIVMLTHEAKESAVKKALAEIDRLDIVRDRTVLIRVEDRLK